jgi:DNA-binding CsgD family transcriptional regulator
MNSMKETEVYAPNFRDGEKVVLVRFPHGGIFEIPELTVNNRQPKARKALGDAKDAIGINSKVAARLSGADFDGDTVLVIPNNSRKIKTAPALEGLKGFDPQAAYPKYDGMKVMSSRTKGIEMGVVSNLITDMTIRGATPGELARAVRHSMVVIDAEKHELNYRQSAIDNGIPQLKAKYQGSARGGASTIVSRKKSSIAVPERRPRPAARGGSVDKETGKKVYEDTGNSWIDKTTGKLVVAKVKVNKLANTDDAHTLSSGTPIERVYADHSNKLKDLANEARRVAVNTKNPPQSPSARAAYANEVASLDAKLNLAYRNKPLERQAQIIGNAEVQMKRQSNPDLDSSELKKVKALALTKARNRTGASKAQITITPSEWDAIQSGAISANKLSDILDNADVDQIKQLATPRTQRLMTTTKARRAEAMAKSGYTQAEIADALGVSLTTLKAAINE